MYDLKTAVSAKTAATPRTAAVIFFTFPNSAKINMTITSAAIEKASAIFKVGVK